MDGVNANNRNKTGQRQELILQTILNDLKILYKPHHPFYVAEHGKMREVDIYILPCARWPKGLVIESKRQETTGTAYEKLIPLADELLTRCSCPAVIVEDGGGAPRHVRAALRRKADGVQLLVFGLSDWLTWISRGNVPCPEDLEPEQEQHLLEI